MKKNLMILFLLVTSSTLFGKEIHTTRGDDYKKVKCDYRVPLSIIKKTKLQSTNNAVVKARNFCQGDIEIIKWWDYKTFYSPQTVFYTFTLPCRQVASIKLDFQFLLE